MWVALHPGPVGAIFREAVEVRLALLECQLLCPPAGFVLCLAYGSKHTDLLTVVGWDGGKRKPKNGPRSSQGVLEQMATLVREIQEPNNPLIENPSPGTPHPEDHSEFCKREPIAFGIGFYKQLQWEKLATRMF